MVLNVAAQAASACRRRAVRLLLVTAAVCLVVGLALAVVDYLGPTSPHPAGWFRPSLGELNLSELAGVAALVLLGVVVPAAVVVAVGVRGYDAWRVGASR